MGQSEFAREIGLGRSQDISNIIKGKYDISPKLANQIVTRFPEISYDFLRGKTKNIQKNIEKSVNIQGINTNFKMKNMKVEQENEIKFLKTENQRLKKELEKYEIRENNLMKLLLRLQVEENETK
jgi:plasmid maintenance system antidote protein VapI